MGPGRLLDKLARELYHCSDSHGECEGCRQRPACLAGYDSLINRDNFTEENVDEFLLRMGKDEEGEAPGAD